MRTFLHSLLGVITLGMVSLGCSKPETPLKPADVTLRVPGMW